ncbi:MAG TPA: NAD(P)H-dependent oxidoreductase [Polyangiaceae bacterium]|jgi:glutathione-regulated potassium-efflux system ancillary protein KefF|nr:NAD(P)H-dependent oxidoreductase [Polyangiaceae bacterium]
MSDAPLVLIFAHPYPDRSIANRKLLEAVEDVEGVRVRSLYDLYPTFDIDVPAEQAALRAAQLVVLQHPMYWYSVPSLLKHWFDKVLVRGFAYGQGGEALWGKRCQWVVTTGGDEHAFGPQGMHGRPFAEFVPVVEQTARFCGMLWEDPFVVYGAHRSGEAELARAASAYRDRLAAFSRSLLHERAPGGSTQPPASGHAGAARRRPSGARARG